MSNKEKLETWQNVKMQNEKHERHDQAGVVMKMDPDNEGNVLVRWDTPKPEPAETLPADPRVESVPLSDLKRLD